VGGVSASKDLLSILQLNGGNVFRIIFLGDIVGKPGRQVLKNHLSSIKQEFSPDLIIANGENSAGGLGIDPSTTQEILAAGVQVITSGNHVWNRRDFLPVLEREAHRVIRPVNYAPGAPGKGTCIWESPDGVKVGIVNAMGRIFMGDLLDCPFRMLDQIIANEFSSVDLIFLDFHAEATSEKVAMAQHLDGRVAVMVGTHTHVQTADERVLAGGLAYISDVGMCGPRDSVIGMESSAVIERFMSGRPAKFEVAGGPPMINGVVLDCEPKARKAVAIQRINRVYE